MLVHGSVTWIQSQLVFCRVDIFSKNFKKYKKQGDKFLINCCKQHISDVYGKNSEMMSQYKKQTTKNYI